MKTPQPLRIILPTDELIEELRTSEIQLSIIQLDLKTLLRYVTEHWLSRNEWVTYYSDSPMRCLFECLEVDFLIPSTYYQHVGPADLRDVRTVVHAVAALMYAGILPAIERYDLPEQSIQMLRVEGWLGDSMMLSTHGPIAGY